MALDLARWQFGLTTVFHFFFVPVTIGLSMLVAVMQTLAYRRQDETWDRLTRFFGRLFLINLAIGVVTGIALTGIVLPLIANTSGWIFTEMGRQPWVVYGVMKTLRGVSPTVPSGEVLTTLIGFTAIYTVLGAVDAALMIRAAHRDLDAAQQPGEQQAPSLVY